MKRLLLGLLLSLSTSWGAMNFTTGTSRAENTGATGFDVDQISILVWLYATSWGSFETVFAADETPGGGSNAIWIHLDGGNNDASFRYYRSIARGQWASAGFALNEWVCLAISYDRTSTSNLPVIYIRRLGTHSSLQADATPDERATPDTRSRTRTTLSPAASRSRRYGTASFPRGNSRRPA
jgi:hypothetical protein